MMLANLAAGTSAIVPAKRVIVNRDARTVTPELTHGQRWNGHRTGADLCATCVLTVDEQNSSGDSAHCQGITL